MMTRNDAIEQFIMNPISAGAADPEEYDIDAIADDVLAQDELGGYYLAVEPEEFWQSVADHEYIYSIYAFYADSADRDTILGWALYRDYESIASGSFPEPLTFSDIDYDGFTKLVGDLTGISLENAGESADWNEASLAESWDVWRS